MKRLFTSFLEVRDHGEDHDTDGNDLAGASGTVTTWGHSLGAYLVPVVSSSVVESGSSLDVGSIVRGRGIAHLALDVSVTVSNGASSWEGVALGLVLLEHESGGAGGALSGLVGDSNRAVGDGHLEAGLVSGLLDVSGIASLALGSLVSSSNFAVGSGNLDAGLVSRLKSVSIIAGGALGGI